MMENATPTARPHQAEHLDVLIVGAGLSGIDAACRLQSGSPARSFALLEARDSIGGTWDLFRYPGVRSDSDMATLGFPFRPWRGDKALASGADILSYIQDTAREYGLLPRIRLRHRIVAADWSSAEHQWTVRYEASGHPGTLTCGFLYVCAGYYDDAGGHDPAWAGMDRFAGQLVRPQFWPPGLDVSAKRVVVIGSGATAVTLVPALANQGAAHVTMLQRSPTYIVSAPARDRHAAALRRRLPARLADAAIRWKNIAYGTFVYHYARRKPDKLKSLIAKGQRRALGPDFDMAHLTPRYAPWDQRLCLVPDGDLFQALRRGQAAIVTGTIDRFTETGLRLASGDELAADIVVCATGLKVRMLGGASLSVDGVVVVPASRLLYKGAMLEGVPNLAYAVGYTNASWTLRCDLTARYVCRLLNHMARHRYASACPEAPAGMSSAGPMLDLTSGYIQRAAALLPRQGRAAPWRVHQNYPLDLLAFRTGRIDDGTLRFEAARVRAAA